MGLFNNLLSRGPEFWANRKPEPEPEVEEEKTFFKFYISNDGTEIRYKFETGEGDRFLQMMSLLLSGGISEEIVECIFDEIKDDEVKEAFIIDLLHRTEESLKDKGGVSVVSPSDFTI
jgi:hypothetical protein